MLIIFTAFAFFEVEKINLLVIVSLSLFGVLIFSLVGMADPEVVKYLRQRFGKNILSALAPLTVLYILTIGYLAMLDQLTTGQIIFPLIYLFLPALLLWWDRHNPQHINCRNLIAILVVWFFIELGLVPAASIPPDKGVSFFLLIALNGII